MRIVWYKFINITATDGKILYRCASFHGNTGILISKGLRVKTHLHFDKEVFVLRGEETAVVHPALELLQELEGVNVFS